MQYLHGESIVHGDLTGSNVLVHGNGRACLSDFGLSTIVLEFVGPSYLTSTMGGNIRWAAAELFEEPDDDEAAVSLSTECDIYSFGSIFLQVLTCKVPYYNFKKDNAVLGQVIRGKKPKPPKDSLLAPAHWQFIQRCWLPRASRPSVGEIVAFVARERCPRAEEHLPGGISPTIVLHSAYSPRPSQDSRSAVQESWLSIPP
ncbi:kinase-like protein [Rhizopogon salebrosus TDB-379]|nr:kinase-like protein [Rhizopogon salebrosus TDB-379]